MYVRPLNRDELAHISEIDVTEDGDLIYRNIGGGLVVESKTWHRPRWDAGECQRRIAELLVEMDRGDTVLGAFDGDRLAGAASLRYRLTEDMAQLVSLHVSQSHRRQGVATALVAEIFRLAQASGAQRIYVSATPSVSAVGFYRSKGFELAEQVNEELFVLEPEDIHMIREVPFPQPKSTHTKNRGNNMDVRAYNREKWDKQVEYGNPWTVPVSPEVIAAARKGEWSVLLTEVKPVPRAWFPPLESLDILCLACGGGQQGPVFAATGGRVTVLDNSPRQLDRDREVADRERLVITTVEGDMRDLSRFADESFDLIFHPVSNNFVPNVLPVWRGAYRVLRRGGVLMAGFMNPDVYVFDLTDSEMGVFELRYPLPFDPTQFSKAERLRMFGSDSPLEFSHTLDDLIGGQLDAGFLLTSLYSDTQNGPLGKFMPAYFATRAIKP